MSPLRRARSARVLFGLVAFSLDRPAPAVDAAPYLLEPTVVQGEREIDWHAGSGSSGPAVGHENDAVLAFGEGLTGRWFSELALRYRQPSGAPAGWDSAEWENVVPLAEPGEWPLDVALALEIEAPRDTAQGASFRVGPLLQGELRNLQFNFNLLAGRYLRDAQPQLTQIEYQGQFKVRYSEPFEFGLQAFGSLGSPGKVVGGYGLQVHRIGPAVFGRYRLPGEQAISYNAALLLGATAASPDRTLRFQLEYEF